MALAQDGRCAICMKRARTRRLAVDHDHDTGAVRALLCYRCNQYLGQWEGDPIAIHNLIVYLWNFIAGTVYEPRLPQALPMATTGLPVVQLSIARALKHGS